MSTRQIDHSTYQEWLHSEVDGGLTTGERSQLRDHLVYCEQCKAERGELIRLEQLLADSHLAVRADFCDEVMASLPAAGWEAGGSRTRKRYTRDYCASTGTTNEKGERSALESLRSH